MTRERRTTRDHASMVHLFGLKQNETATPNGSESSVVEAKMTMIDISVLESEFITKRSPTPLRVTCYGSRSSRTAEKFLQAARSVGYILAKRGHTCVNGGGATGCMGAMNRGAMAGNGNIVGVLHAKVRDVP
jgi:hypothetical protein